MLLIEYKPCGVSHRWSDCKPDGTVWAFKDGCFLPYVMNETVERAVHRTMRAHRVCVSHG